MFSLFIGLFLLTFSSYYIASIFNCAFYFFLVFFALIVFNVQFLSLFKGISSENILFLTLIEFLIFHIIWQINKKPKLNFNFKGLYLKLKNAFVEDKILKILFIFWLIFLFFAFILALFSSVCEGDAQNYHALRVLFWLKDGFISHFETADVRNICMPYNSECFYLYILALSKKDIGFSLLEFFSYISLILSSYKIMELFNIDFKRILWAIFVFSSLSQIIIQISSTQTDLIVAALFSMAIYFVLKFKIVKKINLIYFASLAIGLSFGVKTTSFMIAIPVFVWFIFLLKKDFIKFFSFLFINSAVFSGYPYILNILDFNNPASNEPFVLYNRIYGGIKGFIANYIRYTIKFVDFSGFNFDSARFDFVIKFKDFLLDCFNIPHGLGEIDHFNYINTRMHEQRSSFGVLGLIAFLPALYIGLFCKKVRIFSIIFLVNFLIICASMSYTIFGARYIAGFVALSFPVLCVTYFKKNNFYKILCTIFVIYSFMYCSLIIQTRPLKNLLYEFFSGSKIEVIQHKLRNHEYSFAGEYLFGEAYSIKNAVLPYCRNDNNIALFLSVSSILYPAKYLENSNNCKIDTLNGLHIDNYNLEKYNLLVLEGNYYQVIDSMNKNDKIGEITDNDKVYCFYSKSGSYNGLIKFAQCTIKREYLESLGFNFEKSFTFKQPYGGPLDRVIEVYKK